MILPSLWSRNTRVFFPHICFSARLKKQILAWPSESSKIPKVDAETLNVLKGGFQCSFEQVLTHVGVIKRLRVEFIRPRNRLAHGNTSYCNNVTAANLRNKKSKNDIRLFSQMFFLHTSHLLAPKFH